jgi:phenylalanyl-tRNA synthetase beta chain
MVLDASAVAGTPAKEYLGLPDDYTIEIGLTPNRADAASHWGVARDLAAWLKVNGRKAELALPSVVDFKQDNNSREITATVENGEAAPRYAGLTISGVKVAPSPEWLQRNLRAIGINPKNNIVDITNFVLHEVGQPLHAFDGGHIKGGRIVVRTCPEGTKFTTLDGVERTLSDRDLMICDAAGPMCIAGVLGGAESGVSEETTTIFLESAYFNPVWVRKSAKRHGINTDASFRFERGIDPNITIYALKRAAMLIKELAGGEITSPVTDIVSDREILEPFRFELSLDRLARLVGKTIPEETVKEILAALDVKIESVAEGVLSVAVPPYRVDVRREADLVEDILRIYGYNNVEVPQRVASTLAYTHKPDRQKISETVAGFLSSNGFTETMSNSLTKAAYYDGLSSFAPENCVKILNPLSTDLSVMRQTLLFNMMEAVSLNINHRNANLRMYEFGNTYSYSPEKAAEGGLAPYTETSRLAIALTGQASVQSWNTQAVQSNFFHLRAVVERLLRRLGLDIYAMETEYISNDIYAEGLSVKPRGKSRELFSMGVVSGNIKRVFDIKQDVWFMEMDFGQLLKALPKKDVSVTELPRFPEVRRDLAMLVDKGVSFADLRGIAFATEHKMLKNVSLFDVYEGDKLPEGKKSYALGFVLQDESQTLTDQIIDRIMGNLIRQFEEKAGAVIRQ